MRRRNSVAFEFVENVPSNLEDGVLYVSIPYATAVHKCCCGCGNEVVTPLSPTDWRLTFDGESVSLSPSVGNWSFDCQSHYWIRRNQVRWARRWGKDEVDAGRARDRHATERRLSQASTDVQDETTPPPKLRLGLRQKLRALLRRLRRGV